jgi:hypothetical protein
MDMFGFGYMYGKLVRDFRKVQCRDPLMVSTPAFASGASIETMERALFSLALSALFVRQEQ